jgi:hypothetical protein
LNYCGGAELRRYIYPGFTRKDLRKKKVTRRHAKKSHLYNLDKKRDTSGKDFESATAYPKEDPRIHSL